MLSICLRSSFNRSLRNLENSGFLATFGAQASDSGIFGAAGGAGGGKDDKLPRGGMIPDVSS